MYLTILIPCLNEEKTILYCINKTKKFLHKFRKKSEILIVDNGSSTKLYLLQKKCARVVVEYSKGYGSALITGIKNARGKYIVMGDADGSYDFSNLNPFIEKFNETTMSYVEIDLKEV